MTRCQSAIAALAIWMLVAAGPTTEPAPPAVGRRAPDFTATAVDGTSITLSETLKTGPVVLVVLRGWPGYQCPVCTKQVNDLVRRADDFAAEHAQIVLVYPGPGEFLKDHAKEFAADKSLPKNFTLVIDPGYAVVNTYGLRWDAPGETAYPASFVIDKSGIVRWERISRSHGERATPGQLLDALRASR